MNRQLLLMRELLRHKWLTVVAALYCAGRAGYVLWDDHGAWTLAVYNTIVIGGLLGLWIMAEHETKLVSERLKR